MAESKEAVREAHYTLTWTGQNLVGVFECCNEQQVIELVAALKATRHLLRQPHPTGERG